MLAFLAIVLSVINIFLLLFIIVRFRRLFSTEEIIEKTKAQMNRVIADINNNANRDIDLVNESSRRVKALMNDAEKRMEQFREASEMLRNMIAEVDAAYKKSAPRTVYVQNERLSDIPPVGKPNPYVNPAAAYAAVSPASSSSAGGASRQQSLFEEDSPAAENSTHSTPIEENAYEVNVREDGAAYRQVPLIITKVYEDKPAASAEEKHSRNLNDKVEKLFNEGLSVEEISARLSCSISEVQFIIDLINL